MESIEALTTARPDWQQEVIDWHASALSIAEFCKQRHLVYHQFLYWKRKFGKRGPHLDQPKQSAFVRVNTTPMMNVAEDLTITLPGGILIRGVNETNVSLLRSILEQL